MANEGGARLLVGWSSAHGRERRDKARVEMKELANARDVTVPALSSFWEE